MQRMAAALKGAARNVRLISCFELKMFFLLSMARGH